MTEKFEDFLNIWLSEQPEDITVEEHLHLAGENRVRKAYHDKKLGTLMKKKDPHGYKAMRAMNERGLL
jgi:hypothetical protein